MSTTDVTTIKLFLEQIKEDIAIIRDSQIQYDENLSKDEYAFNYWVLSKLYNVDEDCILSDITEYNDKAIDCFVHFPDSKELYIIQNKYYDVDSNVVTKDLSDFLTRPLSTLLKGQYKKSQELQDIFSKSIEDNDYRIFFHFYTTSTCSKADFVNIIEKFNKYDSTLYNCNMSAEYFNIFDIKDTYYGETFKNKRDFKFNFKTPNKGTFAAVREELNIGVRPAYYIITPISEIYRLFKKAKEEEYQIFSNNIREWLGDNPINKGIIKTLENPEQNKDFLYYNNGITMIYESSESSRPEDTVRVIPLINPQIVNGCQTTNSIYQALKKYTDDEIKNKFASTYVMVKALKKDANDDDIFYENVMKYTNKQNSIPEKAFSSKETYFYKIQQELRDRGFLLEVKPSDKRKFKEIYEDKKNQVDLLKIANSKAEKFDISFTKISDVSISLDKLLQVMLAFVQDGYAAYTKKSCVLKFGHPIYKDFSLKLKDFLTTDSILNIYLMYKKAEIDKNNNDGRNPIPYYLIGFLGYYLKNNDIETNDTNENLCKIFKDSDSINNTYKWLRKITNQYNPKYINKHNNIDNKKMDYNKMIKQKIDFELLKSIIEDCVCYSDDQTDAIKSLINRDYLK